MGRSHASLLSLLAVVFVSAASFAFGQAFQDELANLRIECVEDWEA